MKTKREELYMAVSEHELSVLAFAEAMRNADLEYICTHSPYAALPITPSMATAATRYVSACERLVKINGKKA